MPEAKILVELHYLTHEVWIRGVAMERSRGKIIGAMICIRDDRAIKMVAVR